MRCQTADRNHQLNFQLIKLPFNKGNYQAQHKIFLLVRVKIKLSNEAVHVAMWMEKKTIYHSRNDINSNKYAVVEKNGWNFWGSLLGYQDCRALLRPFYPSVRQCRGEKLFWNVIKSSDMTMINCAFYVRHAISWQRLLRHKNRKICLRSENIGWEEKTQVYEMNLIMILFRLWSDLKCCLRSFSRFAIFRVESTQYL